MTALEGVSGFGKMKTETEITEAVPESRQEEQNSIPTMTGTGTEHEEREGECVQVVERYWSGREDLNLRHPAPKAGALPGCATPRLEHLEFHLS